MYRIVSSKKAIAASAVAGILGLLACFFGNAPSLAVFSEKSVRLPVIMYHQVSENSELWGQYVIPESTLREDFNYIKTNGYTPVSLQAVTEFVSNGTPLPEKPILITFDDGERSFLTKVLPLLKEFSYPATVAVVISLTDLYTKNGETDDRYAYLNWNDLKALSKEPLVEIINHSYNMHSLTARRGMGKAPGESDDDYTAKIKEDFELFNSAFLNYLGKVPTAIAYPYGIKTDILSKIAAEEGCTVALTCLEKVNTLTHAQNKSNDKAPLELGRFNRPYKISSQDFFERKISLDK